MTCVCVDVCDMCVHVDVCDMCVRVDVCDNAFEGCGGVGFVLGRRWCASIANVPPCYCVFEKAKTAAVCNSCEKGNL